MLDSPAAPVSAPARTREQCRLLRTSLDLIPAFDDPVGRDLLLLDLPGGAIRSPVKSVDRGHLVRAADAWGVLNMDLAPVSDPDLVPAPVARTLGLTEAGTRPIADVLLDYVAERRMLLLLDNFEQILDAAGAVVQWLEASPWLKVLVTSRAALHVRGKRRLPVPPLGLPDLQRLPGVAELADYPAVTLFVERAQAVAADFTLTAENAAVVVSRRQALGIDAPQPRRIADAPRRIQPPANTRSSRRISWRGCAPWSDGTEAPRR